MLAVVQEPQCTAQYQPRAVEDHGGLQRVVGLVVEGFDLLPHLDETEHFAGGDVGADDVGGGGAGLFLKLAHEGAADPVDHAVHHVGGDDLPLQRVTADLLGEAFAQRHREVALQRGRDVGSSGTSEASTRS